MYHSFRPFCLRLFGFQIRDLEARVEILSGGQDEALGEMRNILKGRWSYVLHRY